MNEKNSLKKLIPAALCTMAAVCLLDTADAPAYDYTGKTVDNIMLGTSEMKKPDRPEIHPMPGTGAMYIWAHINPALRIQKEA